MLSLSSVNCWFDSGASVPRLCRVPCPRVHFNINPALTLVAKARTVTQNKGVLSERCVSAREKERKQTARRHHARILSAREETRNTVFSRVCGGHLGTQPLTACRSRCLVLTSAAPRAGPPRSRLHGCTFPKGGHLSAPHWRTMRATRRSDQTRPCPPAPGMAGCCATSSGGK